MNTLIVVDAMLLMKLRFELWLYRAALMLLVILMLFACGGGGTDSVESVPQIVASAPEVQVPTPVVDRELAK